MQPKFDKSKPTESHLHAVPANSAWWSSIGYNPVPPVQQGKSDSQRSTFRCSYGGSDSNGGRSQSDDGESEEDDEESHGGSPNAASPRSGEARGRELHNQQADSSMPTMHDDHVSRPPLLELASHSIACASNPCEVPYYAGMIAAYGHPSMAYPFVGIPHVKTPLPLELAQEPIYVNAKQFQGILRRRQARAKAELEKKFIKVRKPYLHESRHQHAMRRERGSGGRFAKKSEMDASSAASEDIGLRFCSALSSKSTNSSGSEPLATDSTKIWDSSRGHIMGQHARPTHHYTNGNIQGGFNPFLWIGKGNRLCFRQEPREHLH